MLKKSDEKKKLFSLLFFILSFIGLMPVILFSGNYIISAIVIAILVVHTIIAVLYYFKGIAFGVMCLVYYAVFVISLGIVIVLMLFVPWSDFIAQKISSVIGIVIMVVFTIVIPLPKIAKQKVL